MSNKDSLNMIAALKENAKKIGDFWKNYKEETSRPNVDKYHAAFNKDDRFTVFKTDVFFSSCTGVYGNSGCSTFMSLDKDIARTHFIKALNKLSPQIFEAMAKSMMEEANGLTEKAEEEIKAMQELLQSVKEAA